MLTSELSNVKRLSSRFFFALLIIIIVFGIVLRCINVDARVYWGDEIVTSLRMSGYTTEEVIKNLSNKSYFTASDLQEYQLPNTKKDLTNTVNGLIVEEPQHAPVYFILSRFWLQLFNNLGNGVTTIRSFSVFIGLISLPCLYLLCLELFKSHAAGLISVAMFAVSPFSFVYSQEARPPVMWILGIIVSSIFFLRAIRINNRISWIVYTISIIFNLYTFIFSLLVFIGHGIYIFATQKFRLTKISIAYLLSTFLGIISFLPWILVLFSSLKTISSAVGWSSEKIGAFNLLRMFLNNMRDVYFSIGDGYAFLTFVLLVIIVFSFWYLILKAPKKVWYFICILSGITIFSILLPDLLGGGIKRSAASRYFVASYLGLNLALSYLFNAYLDNENYFDKYINILNKFVLTSLLILGLISCLTISQSEVSFNQATYRNIINISKTINGYESPLIVSNYNYTNNVIGMMGLSYKIKSETQFQLFGNNQPTVDLSTSKSIFVYGGNNDALIESVKDKYEPKLLFDDLNNSCCSENLWYLKPKQG